MKKTIGILLAVVLALAVLSGCGNEKSETPVTEVKVMLPASTGVRAITEGEAVLATQFYLLSRAYVEKLAGYDLNSFDAEKYGRLISEAAESARIAESFSASLEAHAGELAEAEKAGLAGMKEKASYEQMSVLPANVRTSPFITAVYAAEDKSPAVKYAEEITKAFDNAKNGQKLKAVAEQYGTDLKKAKIMLEQAQAVLEGAAYEKQADFENKCYEAAVETKAAASAIGAGVAIIATGGSAAGIMETGGLVFGGINAIIDVGTAASVHVSEGEGNEYTKMFEKASEAIAPVAAVFSIGGGIQNIKDFRNPEKALEAVDNAAQAFLAGVGFARDYLQDGTVLGVSSNIYNGYKEIIVQAAKTSNPDAAKEVLLSAGVSQEEIEGRSVSETGFPDKYIEAMEDIIDPENPFDAEGFLFNVNLAFRDALIDENIIEETRESVTVTEKQTTAEETTSQAETEKQTTEEPKETETEQGKDALPASEVVGTYAFPGADDTWTQVFTIYDDTHLKATDDAGEVIIGKYDENTGVFFFSDGDEEFMASVQVTFTRAGSGIKADMVLTIGGESAVSSAMRE